MPITSVSGIQNNHPVKIEPGGEIGGDIPSGLTTFLKLENTSGTEKAHYDIRVDAKAFKEGDLPVNGMEPSIELPQGKRVTVFNRSGKATIEVTLTSAAK